YAIEPQFNGALSFSEGLACVMIGNQATGKWGYIDKAGNTVIEPQFELAWWFRNGFAHATEKVSGGKWGYIDKTGKFVWSHE
ncbi:MAG: WG repeat-containing protein, partial [bacterium]